MINIIMTLELPELEAAVKAGQLTMHDADETLKSAQRDLEYVLAQTQPHRFKYAFRLIRPWDRV